MSAALLEVEELRVELAARIGRPVVPVDGVSLRVARGEIVGLVGESGCGKTMTALALMGLLPQPHGRVASGSLRLDGRELRELSARQWRDVRGRRIAMVFQDPMLSLNPYMRLEDQLIEGPQRHLGTSREEARRRAVALLARVGIPEPEARMRAYPHELSGGMRQRAMIAMALLGEPDLLIADEPTTALDVTIQAQILDLLGELRDERGTSIVFITHDLAVVAALCERVLVMYAARVVESGPTRALFEHPLHPYTRALLASTPRVGTGGARTLESIDGLPPRLDAEPLPGCRFAPRCDFVRPACEDAEPALEAFDGARLRRCLAPPEELS